MDRWPAIVRRTASWAQASRWRLSKAMGVPGLEQLSWGCLGFGALSLAALVKTVVDLSGWASARPEQPTITAWVFWVQLAIMVISAVVAYAMRPKPQPPHPADRQAPEVEDGTAIREVFGTVWITNPTELLWRALPEIPIRKKAGKK